MRVSEFDGNSIWPKPTSRYQAGDGAKLKTIITAWVSRPDTVEGEGIAAELVRTIRKIAQSSERLARIEDELKELRWSALGLLWNKVREAELQGEDLFHRMNEQTQSALAAAHAELNHLKSVSDSHV